MQAENILGRATWIGTWQKGNRCLLGLVAGPYREYRVDTTRSQVGDYTR